MLLTSTTAVPARRGRARPYVVELDGRQAHRSTAAGVEPIEDVTDDSGGVAVPLVRRGKRITD